MVMSVLEDLPTYLSSSSYMYLVDELDFNAYNIIISRVIF